MENDLSIQNASKAIKIMRTKPSVYMEKVLGCNSLEIYQHNINDAIAKYSRVSIAACHAVGKSFLLGRVALWFLSMYKNSIVITTAPTNRQVEKILWGEIASAYKNSRMSLGGNLTQRQLKFDDKWYALGFSPSKEASSGDGEQSGSSLQGWHSNFILIIFDEAVGIPSDIWTQVEGLLTSGAIVKFVCIANPTTKSCNFFDTFDNPAWHNIYISCFDSRNLQANGIFNLDDLEKEIEKVRLMSKLERLEYIESYKKVVTHLVSCQWVVEKALEWGIHDPRFQGKALGIFPDIEDCVFIQRKDVELAQSRTGNIQDGGFRYIGVDCARYGDDETVFTEIIDAEIDEGSCTSAIQTRIKKTIKKDLMQTTGALFKFIMDEYEDGENVIILIDGTGIGSGVFDRLNELKKEGKLPKKVNVYNLHFGGSVKLLQKKKKATKSELQEQKDYANIKSLMFQDLSKAVKNDLKLLNDPMYTKELPTIRYDFKSNGQLLVESKKDYKKRTGKNSPDASDSLAMANLARRFRYINNYLESMKRKKLDK